MGPSARRAGGALLLVASVGLSLAACGDDGTSGSPESTTTSAPTTSTAPASTTSGPPEPASTTVADYRTDAEVVADLARVYATLHQQVRPPIDPWVTRLGEIFTEPALSRWLQILRDRIAIGVRYEGGYDMEVLDVSVEGDRGMVTTCGHDLITRYAPDGSVEDGPEPEPVEVDFDVRRVDGEWRISEVTSYDLEPCTIG